MNNRRWLWFWLLNALTHIGYAAVALRIDPFLRRDPLYGDAVHFDRIAWSLANGGWFDLDLHRAPLYPLMMAGLYSVFGHVPELVRLLSGVFVFLGAVFMVPMVRHRFGERVALWFLALYSLHPLMIHISGWLYTEPLMIMLVGALASAYYFGRLAGYSPRWLLLIGVILGLMSLTRSNGLYFSFVLAAWMAWDARKLGAVRSVAAFGVTLLLVGAIVAPWTYRNFTRWGKVIPVASGGKHLWASNNDLTDGRVLRYDSDLTEGVLNGQRVRLDDVMRGMNPRERDEVYGKIAKEWILSNPGRFIGLLPRKLYFTLAPISFSPSTQENVQTPMALTVFTNTVFGLFLLGVGVGFARVWRQSWADTLPLWLLAAVLFGSALVFNGSSRYILPIAPAMCLFFACAVGFRRSDPTPGQPDQARMPASPAS